MKTTRFKIALITGDYSYQYGFKCPNILKGYTFYYHTENGGYVITEKESGMAAAEHHTLDEALILLLLFYYRLGAKEFKAHIKKKIADHNKLSKQRKFK